MIHNFFIRFLNPWLGIAVLLTIPLVVIARKFLRKAVIYRYSLTSFLKKNHHSPWYKKIFFISRLVIFSLLTALIAKIQIVDSRSKIPVSGVDIVLVMDVSGSMQYKDYDDDNRSRFEVAKAEAIRFIEKRHSDALGLVLFGKDTVSRCPITFDKQLLRQVVEELEIGVIDSELTMLVTGMVTAANRLKHSKAKSKIMIVLTDGEPSEGDLDPSIGIDIAKKLGIKVYTIGIGSEQEQMFFHPFYGRIPKPKVNKELLTKIAHETGGNYFFARSASDMRSIYDKIDRLEKTDHEVPLFSLYYDMLIPLILTVMVLMILELALSTFIWFAL